MDPVTGRRVRMQSRENPTVVQRVPQRILQQKERRANEERELKERNQQLGKPTSMKFLLRATASSKTKVGLSLII
jgi:hypothetical protein